MSLVLSSLCGLRGFARKSHAGAAKTAKEDERIFRTAPKGSVDEFKPVSLNKLRV